MTAATITVPLFSLSPLHEKESQSQRYAMVLLELQSTQEHTQRGSFIRGEIEPRKVWRGADILPLTQPV